MCNGVCDQCTKEFCSAAPSENVALECLIDVNDLLDDLESEYFGFPKKYIQVID